MVLLGISLLNNGHPLICLVLNVISSLWKCLFKFCIFFFLIKFLSFYYWVEKHYIFWKVVLYQMHVLCSLFCILSLSIYTLELVHKYPQNNHWGSFVLVWSLVHWLRWEELTTWQYWAVLFMNVEIDPTFFSPF